MDADQIIVFDEGGNVGRGRHEELRKAMTFTVKLLIHN